MISPQKHSFTSLVYDAAEDRHFTEHEYENIDVVDRIGSGDAYVAGALYGLLRFGTIDEAVEKAKKRHKRKIIREDIRRQRVERYKKEAKEGRN